MDTTQFVYWIDGEYYLGYLAEYPDYLTQALLKTELVENLKDLWFDLTNGEVPYVRKIEELTVA